MSVKRFPRFQVGQKVAMDGALLNRLFDEVERLGKWSVGGAGANFSNGAGGFSLVVAAPSKDKGSLPILQYTGMIYQALADESSGSGTFMRLTQIVIPT